MRRLPAIAFEVRQLRELLPPEEASTDAQELPIRVYCRFRSQNQAEEVRGGQEAWNCDANTVSIAPCAAAALGPLQKYPFDCVFAPEASQRDVYLEVLPVIKEVLADGGNSSILCYGQTSAGKTFTIEGEEGERRGLLPRSLETVFEWAEDVSISVSMLEIYMEKLRDLLVDGPDLSVVEDRQGVVVRGLQEVPTPSLQHAMEVWHLGRQQRITAATGMNERSSRSHCIFTIYVRGSSSSKLSIVDLAGSECVKKVVPGKFANKEIVEEAKAINQSLSTLGLVINRLAKSRHSEVHIPYRSSKLTRVLQDSLGGGSRTVLLLNCSISSLQAAETLSTLRFGTRARSCINVVPTAEEPFLLKTLRAARQELERLQVRAWRDDDSFSLSSLSHEESVGDFSSPDGVRPRFVQHGLELSLVEEASSEEELPHPGQSLARRSSSRRTSRRMSRPSRQSIACRDLSPSPSLTLLTLQAEVPAVCARTACWEYPLTNLEKRRRLVAILAKELSGAENELKDVQRLANELQEQCDAMQAETEWLRAAVTSADDAHHSATVQDDSTADAQRLTGSNYLAEGNQSPAEGLQVERLATDEAPGESMRQINAAVPKTPTSPEPWPRSIAKAEGPPSSLMCWLPTQGRRWQMLIIFQIAWTVWTFQALMAPKIEACHAHAPEAEAVLDGSEIDESLEAAEMVKVVAELDFGVEALVQEPPPTQRNTTGSEISWSALPVLTAFGSMALGYAG